MPHRLGIWFVSKNRTSTERERGRDRGKGDRQRGRDRGKGDRERGEKI